MLIHRIDDTLGGVLSAATCPKIGGKVEACRISITNGSKATDVFLSVAEMRSLATDILASLTPSEN